MDEQPNKFQDSLISLIMGTTLIAGVAIGGLSGSYLFPNGGASIHGCSIRNPPGSNPSEGKYIVVTNYQGLLDSRILSYKLSDSDGEYHHSENGDICERQAHNIPYQSEWRYM